MSLGVDMDLPNNPTIPTLAALNKTNWQTEIIKAKSYHDLVRIIFTLENGFSENSEEMVSLQWLRSLCLLDFSRSISTFEPFSSREKNSASMDTFNRTDIKNYLCDVFGATNNCNLLKARLGDLLWSICKPRTLNHAIVAIDCYSSVPIEYTDDWWSLNEPCWERAIVLCNALKSGAGKRGSQLATLFYERLVVSEDHFQRINCARLILSASPFLEDKSAEFGRLFLMMGIRSTTPRDAQNYYQISKGFYHRAKEFDMRTELSVLCADCELQRGIEIYHEAHNGRFFQAFAKFESAVQQYLMIPNYNRAQHDVDVKLKASQDLSRQCFKEIGLLMPTHPLDRRIASGLSRVGIAASDSSSPFESLVGLTSLVEPVDMERLRIDVENEK